MVIDMISGAPLSIKTGSTQNELKSGLESTRKSHQHFNIDNVPNYTNNKHIFRYDRLCFCKELIELHTQQETYFIARC